MSVFAFALMLKLSCLQNTAVFLLLYWLCSQYFWELKINLDRSYLMLEQSTPHSQTQCRTLQLIGSWFKLKLRQRCLFVYILSAPSTTWINQVP